MHTVKIACLLLTLIAIPQPTKAGSITYAFLEQQWPHDESGYLTVDDSVLGRGEIDTADVLGFAFLTFGRADLLPFSIPIGSDGEPTRDGAMLFASHVLGGTTYRLHIDFGPDAFVPIAGAYYQASEGNRPGINGYGWWTMAEIAAQSQSVPEPSSLILWIVAIICIYLVRRVSR